MQARISWFTSPSTCPWWELQGRTTSRRLATCYVSSAASKHEIDAYCRHASSLLFRLTVSNSISPCVCLPSRQGWLCLVKLKRWDSQREAWQAFRQVKTVMPFKWPCQFLRLLYARHGDQARLLECFWRAFRTRRWQCSVTQILLSSSMSSLI